MEKQSSLGFITSYENIGLFHRSILGFLAIVFHGRKYYVTVTHIPISSLGALPSYSCCQILEFTTTSLFWQALDFNQLLCSHNNNDTPDVLLTTSRNIPQSSLMLDGFLDCRKTPRSLEEAHSFPPAININSKHYNYFYSQRPSCKRVLWDWSLVAAKHAVGCFGECFVECLACVQNERFP